LSNSPGEIFAWVPPVLDALSELKGMVNTEVILLPCRYASGNEKQALEKSRQNIDDSSLNCVYSPRQSIKKILFGSSREYKQNPGVILFLGGDPLWAYLLSRKTSYSVIAYTEHQSISFEKSFYKVYKRDRDGDLMLDGLASNEGAASHDTNNKKKIVFLPSSRPKHFEHLLPFFKETARYLPSDWQIIFKIAPSIELSPSKIEAGDDFFEYDYSGNNDIFFESQLAVTIPGTNNILLAASGLPSLVVLPLNKAELIDIDGLAGAVLNWGFMRRIKRTLIKKMALKMPWVSSINRKEKRTIFPEVVSELSPKDLAEKVIDLFASSQLPEIKDRLKTISFKRGIAGNIVSDIKGMLSDS
jgi:hypothetical protein